MNDCMPLHGTALILQSHLEELTHRDLSGSRPKEILTYGQSIQHKIGNRGILPHIALKINVFS